MKVLNVLYSCLTDFIYFPCRLCTIKTPLQTGGSMNCGLIALYQSLRDNNLKNSLDYYYFETLWPTAKHLSLMKQVI
jgi:hypothetical protein